MRSAPGFGSTTNSAALDPVWLGADDRIQPAELDTSQAQAFPVATPIDRRPPAGPIAVTASVSSKRQGASRCRSVATNPFTRTVPERPCEAVFSCTVSVTLPSPCPLVGSAVTHGTSLATVHAHSRAADTVIVTRRSDSEISEGTPATVV